MRAPPAAREPSRATALGAFLDSGAALARSADLCRSSRASTTGHAGLPGRALGPVATVYRIADEDEDEDEGEGEDEGEDEGEGEDEAVALANTSPYGLGGAVFAADPERARGVADRLEAGMVRINHPTASRPELPFGGIKCSGYGRELGDVGIVEFANRKLVRYADADAPIEEVPG